MMIEFQAWPKIARLNRDMIITEKIDGTNAAVGFQPIEYGTDPGDLEGKIIGWIDHNGDDVAVYAQSRKKLITPKQDNAGFAKWVQDHTLPLYLTLGPGLHFGEWWGSGIQRGYGLQNGEKRFSLFNTPRYGDSEKFNLAPLKDIGVDTVPVLFKGPFDTITIQFLVERLKTIGSIAAPGYMNPEGIIVFHVAAQIPFKVTIVGDEKPKGSAE